MSYPSIWTSEAEPPFDEQPVSPDDEPTLDLAEPPLAAAAREGAAQDEPQGEPGDEDETLDLSGLAEETLVGCELQQGKYQVLALREERLLSGPLLGASYTALHTDLQKRLTLRYLPLDPNASAAERDETTMQFLREVRVLAKLDHPSLPRVHDYFCEGEACYVVMDELAERTLADVLAEAAQEGRVPALPPVQIAQLGLELARALGYLHQQHSPLVLGGLRAEDIALPADGPAQLVSLGALSMVAALPSVSLPGVAALSALPAGAQMTQFEAAGVADMPTAPGVLAGGESACQPTPGDDLYGLGVLLRELAGGAEVVARVMDRLQRPEEVLLADDADDAPPISLMLAGVIQIAAHEEPGRRFQQAAALETALMRAWMVERRIVRQAERGRRDEWATRLENGEDDLAGTSVEQEPPEGQYQEMATRVFGITGVIGPDAQAAVCWRCGGHNVPGTLLCRVCGARQPGAVEERGRARPSGPRRRTRRLPTRALEEAAWAAWTEDEMGDAPALPRRARATTARLAPEELWLSTPKRRVSAPPQRRRDGGRNLLWGLVWACFFMAALLGGATMVVTYLALR